MSRAQLYRQFKREIDCTPGEYQQKLRLDQARDRLARSTAPITQICFDLGYRSASHFSRCFKVATGETPSGYRSRAGEARPLIRQTGSNPAPNRGTAQ